MEAVGAYLRMLRETAGLSQDEVAAQIGIVSKTISRWENGENEPAVTTLAPLVKFLKGSMARVIALWLNEDQYPDETLLTPDELHVLASLTSEQRAILLAAGRQMIRPDTSSEPDSR